jgi:tetratricopeptide (TPR) repeat protein
MHYAALALLPSLILQAPAPTTKRTAVLLIPMDKGAESQVVMLESYMIEALSQFPSAAIKKTDELLGLPPDEEAEAALKRSEGGYKEGKASFDAREWEDAERKLRADIKEFHKSAAAMKTCGDLCDAMAMYAAVLQQRGDVEEAKLQLIDLLALNPSFEFDTKRYSHDFLVLRTQVATGHSALLRGSVLVKTKPAGARLTVDGEFAGYSPMTLATMPIGKHLLRIERPGFKMFGEVLEVTPEDTDMLAELKPTAQYKAYDGQLDKIAAEVSRDSGGSAITGVGKSLGLDRGLVGTVKELGENGATELVIGVYDMKNGKRLAWKKAVFQGDEFGQLKPEISRLVNSLVNAADGNVERVAKSSDPLDGRHGMEEWNAEDRGQRSKNPAKKKTKDPLDGMNGTEDW